MNNNTNTSFAANVSSSAGLYSESQHLQDLIPKVCKDGVILPFWPTDGSTLSMTLHGIVYFLALMYIFVGVAIIADRFMAAIEQITSQEQDVIIRKPNGEKEIISVRIWNETVSNLTLMALGSSAPEILLSVIEIYAQHFEAGDLGPGTIVGSAAFNMFVIIAICVWVVPEPKKIKHLRVFCITLVFSVFAYIWLLYILIWSSYGVIEVWEAFLTFMFFPITVLIAYIADRRLLIYKYLDKRYRMKRGRKVVYGGHDAADGETLELTGVEANGVKLKVNEIELKGDLKYIDASDDELQDLEDHREEIIEIVRNVKNNNPNASSEELIKLAQKEIDRLQPKSKAYYRIQAARKIMGTVGEKMKDHIIKSINDDFDDEEQKDQSIKIYFNPKEYTVLENIGSFQLTITRTGGLESTILVDYATENGTAKSGSDYEPTSGVLSFGPGEQHKQISIKIINDDIYEEDEYFFVRLSDARYLAPSDGDEDARPVIDITDATAKVMILDDDHSGVFSFTNNSVQIPESIGAYNLRVCRFVGARGHVSLPYKTIAGTAKPGIDFHMVDSKIEFANNETHKDIVLSIVNTDSYEKNVSFSILLGDPIRKDHNKKDVEDKGAPRLGELVKCSVKIRESRDFKATVDKLMRQKKAVNAISRTSWEGQFIEAVRVPSLGSAKEEDDEVDVRVVEKKSFFAYILHGLTLFWKIVFACVPPPNLYNGWPCFVVSIIIIGILTAFINDVASHFGCTIGLADAVTAISLVALGTSVPDTFASKIAAINDKYADSSIGNVTGSNAVNVFLGIGVAWTIAAVYHAFKQTPGGFRVDPGNLAFSVSIFCISAFVCAGILLLRRKFIGGELGGPLGFRLTTSLLLVGLWLLYVVLSSLEVYHIIHSF